ncbi:MAG: matrixin family metalloprotease [Caulobacteraceae bacterium]
MGTWTLTASGANVGYSGVGGARIVGNSDTIASAGGLNAPISATGTGEVFDLNGGAITLGAASSGSLDGSNVKLSFNGDGTIDVTAGMGDSVYGFSAGDYANFSANTAGTLIGSGGRFDILGAGVSLTASNDAGVLSAGASGSLFGNNLTLGFNGDGTINVMSGKGDSFSGFLTGADVNLSANTSATLIGAGGLFSVLGAGVSVTASNDTGILSADASAIVTGNNDGANVGANAAITVHGAGADAILQSGAAATFVGSGNTGADALNVTGGLLTFTGTGEIAKATGATIDLGSAATGVTIDNTGNTVNDVANVSGGIVNIGASNITTSVGGLGVQVDGGSATHEIIQLFGQDVTVNASNAYQVNFVQGSTGGVANGSNNTVLLGTDVNATVNGNDNVGFNGDPGGGGGTSLTFNGTGADYLSNGSVYLASTRTNLTLNGLGVTVQDVSGVTGGVVNVNATSDTESVANATLNLAGNISTEVLGAGNLINAPTSDDGSGANFITVGGSTGADTVNWLGGNQVGAGSWNVQFNPTSSETALISDWSGANASGTQFDNLTDYTNNTSLLNWYNPESGVSSVSADFTGVDETGAITTEGLDTTNGYSEDFTFQYDSSNSLLGWVQNYYQGSNHLGYADFNSTGQITDYSGAYGNYGYYVGGYDFAKSGDVKASRAGGQNIAKIAAFDVGHGQIGAASAAEGTRFQSELTTLAPATAGILAPAVHAARWTGGAITWSIAAGAGPAGAPFSGALSAPYQSLVQKAFAAWAAATGLKFVEVADSAKADIRIGWGAFDGAASGVLGYTSSPVKDGVLQAGAVIRLEDPSQLALTADAGGQLAYSGTDAEFTQVLLHEIGHAIGLGDSADPASIMYAVAGAADRTLTASDIAAAAALYATTPGAATALASQAFRAPAGSQVSPIGMNRAPSGQVVVLSNAATASALAATHAAPAPLVRFIQASAAFGRPPGVAERMDYYPAEVRMNLSAPRAALA